MILQESTKNDLAIAGAGFLTSMLFTSSNGGGQNLLHVLTLMLFIASVASIVSFIIARWVATLALAVAASAVITDLLFMIYFMYSIAYRDSADPHAVEAYLLIPIVFTVVTAPLVGLSSFGIGRIANRYFHDQPLHSESAAATERPADPQHPTSV